MRLTVEFDKFIQASSVWVSAGAAAAGANLGHAATIAESEQKPSNESNSRGGLTMVHSVGRNKHETHMAVPMGACRYYCTCKILLYL